MTADITGQRDPLAAALKRELGRGERVWWQGRQLARVNPRAFSIYLFAIPWTAFALFWTAMAGGFALIGQGINAGEFDLFSLIFPLFGLPFILIGIAMLASPFIPLFGARKVIFAVTDKRIIRLKTGRVFKTEIVPAENIGQISKIQRSDGSGTITVITATSGGVRSAMKNLKIGEVADASGAGEAVTRLAETANPDGKRG